MKKILFLIVMIAVLAVPSQAADIKISALPAVTSTTPATDVIPVVASGVTSQITVANLLSGYQVNLSLLKGTLTNSYLCTYTSSGTLLILTDSTYFQAGSNAATTPMGSVLSNIAGDYIKVGATLAAAETVQITDINYTTNTLTISPAITREDGDYVWLYKKSDGDEVQSGSNPPDMGAHPYTVQGEGTAQLAVTKTGDGTGLIQEGTHIECGATCSHMYYIYDNNTVTLSVTPSTGSYFNGWSGDCTGATCTLTMTADKT